MDPMNPMEQQTAAEPEQARPTLAEATARLEALVTEGAGADGLAKLKEKLRAMKAPSGETTVSGSEAPDLKPKQESEGEPDAPAGKGQPEQPFKDAQGKFQKPAVLTGKDVEWSEYNLDYNIRHLYPKSAFVETPYGPKWVVRVADFMTRLREFGNSSFDKKVNAPTDKNEEKSEFLNLAQFLKDMVNGPEQWRISALMPIKDQCGVLLEREVPLILPDPEVLKKSEEVEAPTSPELKNLEDAAIEYMKNEGLTPATAVSDDTTTPAAVDVGLRPIVAGTPEHEAALAQLDEEGAVAPRVSSAISRALATAAPETLPPPVPKGIQPDPVQNASQGGELTIGGGFSAANEFLRALNDPAFRASLPTED